MSNFKLLEIDIVVVAGRRGDIHGRYHSEVAKAQGSRYVDLNRGSFCDNVFPLCFWAVTAVSFALMQTAVPKAGIPMTGDDWLLADPVWCLLRQRYGG